MAAPRRRQTSSLEDVLLQEGHSFEFHQAVRLYEQAHPTLAPIGEGESINVESLRVKSHIFMSWPPGEIQKISYNQDEKQPTLVINFLGIAGLQGPLPSPYTELVLERIKHHDYAMRDFLDIFNHRLAGLFHRTRKKHWLGLDRALPHETQAAQCLKALVGIATKGLQDRFDIPDRSLLAYSGLIWHNSRTNAGLKKLITHFFKIPVMIHELQGRWLKLEPDQCTRLAPQGPYNRLGHGAALGTKAWSQQNLITLQLGPMDLEIFKDFLKTGKRYQSLSTLVRFYVDPSIDFNLNLVIKKGQVPPLKLDGTGALGWTSWLKQKEFNKDDGQVRFRVTSENF